MSNSAPVIFIVGPTASGKTALAIQIAQQYRGEIICADSRTVYRGMDLGTAKPTLAEQQIVPHHLIDVVNPDKPFSVVDFKHLATKFIRDIQGRGNLPMIVGGSGLYIDALLYDFSFRPVSSAGGKQGLAGFSDDQLRVLLDEKGIELNPSDQFNRRRLERAVSSGESLYQPREIPKNYYIIGLNPGIEMIEQRIVERTKQWFEKNILEETDVLATTFGMIEPLNTPPYREILEYRQKGGNVAQLQALINLHLRQLAKRQITWFKRNTAIEWVKSHGEATNLIKQVAGKV